MEQLLEGPQRYGDLQRQLGVPTNMLATRLKELEAAGVLRRLPIKHNTRACVLTDRGLELADAITALGRWGASLLGPEQRSTPGEGAFRATWSHTGRGSISR